MCRLALLNRQAVCLLESWGALEPLLKQLECSFGGHGNGVATLWSETGRVTIQKGVALSTEKAARVLSRATEREADWMLFHTRRASSSAIADQHCHPFRAGKLTLAHNGHDADFARLGRSIGITDSELITKTWSRLHIPLAALDGCTGVFIGFQQNAPFVIKGTSYSDLVAAWHKETGAILFASELPLWLAEGAFDRIVEIRRLAWFGRSLDCTILDAVPYRPYPRRQWQHTSSASHWDSSEYPSADMAELAEEAEAFYADMLDEDEEDVIVDKDGNILSARVAEAQLETDWRMGKQVEDECNTWWR